MKAPVAKMPGVLKVVRDGSFLGVIAEREEQAAAALDTLADEAEWQVESNLPPADELYQHLLGQAAPKYAHCGGHTCG